MFRAIGRYIRAIGYLVTGRIDKARRALMTDPNVIRATYDQIITEKKTRINQYKDAVAGMIGQEEKKKAKLKSLTEEIQQLERLKAGAAAMAKKLVEKHNGDVEAVKNDPEYTRCQAAFTDFSATLSEKEQRADELEADMEALCKGIADHKTQIQAVLRDFEKIKEEKHDAVADVISAREEQQIADMVSGLSEDRSSEELAELRDLRREVKAKARMSREMSGLDTKRDEEEFLAYATESVANDEFDALIGLSKEKEEDGEPPEETKIPEA
ncbi:PspA/IM30 family protein [Planctomycetota bacterium]